MIAGRSAAVTQLAPLVAARRALQPVIVRWDATALLAAPARHLPTGTAGVLIVGNRRRSPGTMLPGLFLRDAAGRAVPVGWLPDVGASLATYATGAVRVLARSGADQSLVVLGQWEDRFLRSSLRAVRWAGQHGRAEQVMHWTADRLSRPDMLAGLRLGPALAIYFGHGRARGWAGYQGVRAEDFTGPWLEPVGALLALCCENASRHRTGLSFAERVVLAGACGAMLAAVTKTRHEYNRRWGPALCEAWTASSAPSLAELVATAETLAAVKGETPYRFIGDPLMLLAGASGATTRAARVFAPAPDAVLPPWAEASA